MDIVKIIVIIKEVIIIIKVLFFYFLRSVGVKNFVRNFIYLFMCLRFLVICLYGEIRSMFGEK